MLINVLHVWLRSCRPYWSCRSFNLYVSLIIPTILILLIIILIVCIMFDWLLSILLYMYIIPIFLIFLINIDHASFIVDHPNQFISWPFYTSKICATVSPRLLDNATISGQPVILSTAVNPFICCVNVRPDLDNLKSTFHGSIRSTWTVSHGGTRRSSAAEIVPYALVPVTLFRWQTSQVCTNFVTSFFRPGHK